MPPIMSCVYIYLPFVFVCLSSFIIFFISLLLFFLFFFSSFLLRFAHVLSFSLSLSLYLFIYLSLYLSVSLFFSLSLLSLCLVFSLLFFFLSFFFFFFFCSENEASAVEEAAVQVLCSLVLRLSESSFRPLFLAFVEWGLHADAPRTRRLAFHRAVDGLAAMLKGLFVPYFASVLRSCVDALQVKKRKCHIFSIEL